MARFKLIVDRPHEVRGDLVPPVVPQHTDARDVAALLRRIASDRVATAQRPSQDVPHQTAAAVLADQRQVRPVAELRAVELGVVVLGQGREVAVANERNVLDLGVSDGVRPEFSARYLLGELSYFS